MIRMLRTLLGLGLLSLSLVLPVSLSPALPLAQAGTGNPCQGRVWVTDTILALHGDDQSGIGGTGHGGDDYGMGGTGRTQGNGGDDVGIGGTGHSQDGSGIGGTGRQARGEEGLGGTGIVGVVAGFGSICVGGLEIHYGNSTPFRLDGQAAETRLLALGQAVSVRTTGSSEHLTATEISVLNTVVGPVASAQADRFQILGQTVIRPAGVSDAELTPGRWLAVAGSRLPDGRILATRLAPATPGANVSLLGPVSLSTTDSGTALKIGEQTIQLPTAASLPLAGEEIWVKGRLDNGVLQTESLQTSPRTHFAAGISRLLLEGYVRQKDGRSVNIEGKLITLPEGMESDATPGNRVQIQARLDTGGRMQVDRLLLERPAADARQRQDGMDAPSNNASAANRGGDSRPDNAARASEGRPDAARPDATRPDAARIDLMRPEFVRPDIVRPDIVRPESVRPDFGRPDIPRRR